MSQRDPSLPRLETLIVFELPKSGENCLRVRPPENPTGILLSLGTETVHSPFDRGRGGEQVRPLARIAQSGAELKFTLADYAFGIHGQPPSPSIEQYVFVMQIAVKKAQRCL